METSFRNIFINSTLAFVSAFIFTTFIHEFGHYVSYWLFGADPTLFHNYVQTPDQPLTIPVRVISALAGPVVSLVQGIVFGLVVSRREKNTGSHLFFLWLSLLGFVSFFGYLVVTPLSTTGDTGMVAELLNIDYTIRVLIAVLGMIVLLWTILKTAKTFSRFIPVQHDLKMRAKYVYHLMFFPIIIGSVVNTLLAFPVVSFLSILYPAMSPYVIMSSFSVILKTSNSKMSSPECEKHIKQSLLFLALCAILLNRLLTFGIG